MPKLTNSFEWHRLAKAQAALDSLNLSTNAEALSRHTGYDKVDVEKTIADETYKEFAALYKQRRFGLWAEALTKAGDEIQRMMKKVGHKALLVLDDLLDSDDDKVRVSAARLAFDFNPDMERPVIRHEITSKFSADELQQARDIVSKLKKPKLELPSGNKPVN
jgi:hypothetical protein